MVLAGEEQRPQFTHFSGKLTKTSDRIIEAIWTGCLVWFRIPDKVQATNSQLVVDDVRDQHQDERVIEKASLTFHLIKFNPDQVL